MNSANAFWQIVIALLVSVGGAGILAAALSSWLGRVWATRIGDAERARLARELETYKSEMQHLLDDRRDALTRKRDMYARLATSMRVFIGGPRPVSAQEKQSFLEAFDHASLWASEEVAAALSRFLETSVRHSHDPRSVSNDEFKNAYRTCVVAMRRDCGFPDTTFTYPVVQFD